jgi:hypothetical protein
LIKITVAPWRTTSVKVTMNCRNLVAISFSAAGKPYVSIVDKVTVNQQGNTLVSISYLGG